MGSRADPINSEVWSSNDLGLSLSASLWESSVRDPSFWFEMHNTNSEMRERNKGEIRELSAVYDKGERGGGIQGHFKTWGSNRNLDQTYILEFASWLSFNNPQFSSKLWDSWWSIRVAACGSHSPLLKQKMSHWGSLTFSLATVIAKMSK